MSPDEMRAGLDEAGVRLFAAAWPDTWMLAGTTLTLWHEGGGIWSVHDGSPSRARRVRTVADVVAKVERGKLWPLDGSVGA